MVKKVQTGMIIFLAILIIVILLSMGKKDEYDYKPQDIVYDFFMQMLDGKVVEAMEKHFDEVKDSQVKEIEKNKILFDSHFRKYAIDILTEEIDDAEGIAKVNIYVCKLDYRQIYLEAMTRAIENSVAGAQISDPATNQLLKKYIDEAYELAESKYNLVENEYTLTLNLILNENEEFSWEIVNDENITDILFGMQSDDKYKK